MQKGNDSSSGFSTRRPRKPARARRARRAGFKGVAEGLKSPAESRRAQKLLMSRMMRSDSTLLRERGAKLKLSLPLIFWRGLMWKAPTSEPTKALTFASLMFESAVSKVSRPSLALKLTPVFVMKNEPSQ